MITAEVVAGAWQCSIGWIFPNAMACSTATGVAHCKACLWNWD